jgi:hypothetical protein
MFSRSVCRGLNLTLTVARRAGRTGTRPVVGLLRGGGGQLDPEDRARHELAEVARVDLPAEDRGDLLVDPGALPEQRGQGGQVIQWAFVRHLILPG